MSKWAVPPSTGVYLGFRVDSCCENHSASLNHVGDQCPSVFIDVLQSDVAWDISKGLQCVAEGKPINFTNTLSLSFNLFALRGESSGLPTLLD